MLSYLKNSLRKIRSRWRYAKLEKSFNINLFRQIFIDPCFNICNLSCPYCPVGQKLKLNDMSKGMMTSDDFKQIWMKSLSGYQGKIGLYNWGESFLNPELPAIVNFLKTDTEAKIVLNSNFSFGFDDRITDILKLLDDDTIIISCDGFSQSICGKYRVNVNFEKVIHNAVLISKNKKPVTKLKWQYLKFPWNASDIESARKFCEENKIIFYTGEGGITPNYPMFPTPVIFNEYVFRCEFFLDTLTINFDGEVYPCCAYYGPTKYSIGNAKINSLGEIFVKGKGKIMLDYLMYKSKGENDIFCKHCVERNVKELEFWKVQ